MLKRKMTLTAMCLVVSLSTIFITGAIAKAYGNDESKYIPPFSEIMDGVKKITLDIITRECRIFLHKRFWHEGVVSVVFEKEEAKVTFDNGKTVIIKSSGLRKIVDE